MKQFALCLAVTVFLVGCVGKTVSHYTVKSEHDKFTQTVAGKTVTFENWKLTCGDQTFEIPQEPSEIEILQRGEYIKITVNEEVIYEE